MRTRILFGCACGAALLAPGQSLNIGQGGISTSDRGSVALAPPPRTVGQALVMADLPIAASPPLFYLNCGTSGRYGPYALADNTAVGSKQAPYLLRMFDYGQHFTLHPSNNTAITYGPFAATNGATVAIGNTVMSVLRFPPRLSVTLNHPGKINQTPLIGIAPYNSALIRELYGLRAKYVNLANRVDVDSADVQLEGTPRIYSRRAGSSFSPVVSTSARDKQNASKGAELSAINFLETLFGQAFRIRSQAITEGTTYHFGMPPGDYVFCALQKVKDARTQGITGSATAVWWTTFHFDGEHPLALFLTADNAITWREIFPFDKK
ncbi:MAG TPA: hypothetical protein PKM57_07340 [Kiritimatiellia bacterium]|nr:hypothetical protein [Kiritimatiellia bacterium]HPS07814.1 hypothetical protein [Kiritimatiellia bacterium]